MEAGQCSNTETMGNSMHGATAVILDPAAAADITSIQESGGQTRKGELLPDYTGADDIDGTNSERRAGKRIHVLQSTTEENNIKQTGAKVRKQKPLDGHFSMEGTEYAKLFSSMKVIVERYAVMNEKAGDVSPF